MKIRSLFRGQHGASAVETALMLPLMVLLLFGIIDIGRFYWAEHAVTHAANEAARLAVLEGVTTQEVNDVITFHLHNWPLAGAPQIVENTATIPATTTVSVTISFNFLFLPNFIANAFNMESISYSVTMRSER